MMNIRILLSYHHRYFHSRPRWLLVAMTEAHLLANNLHSNVRDERVSLGMVCHHSVGVSVEVMIYKRVEYSFSLFRTAMGGKLDLPRDDNFHQQKAHMKISHPSD